MSNRGISLMELIVVIAVSGIMMSFAAPPFLAMLQRATPLESAQRVQEIIKMAQLEAQKRGFINISSPTGPMFVKRSIYLALNESSGVMRIIAWEDRMGDQVKRKEAFFLLQEQVLGKGTTFSVPSTITLTGCGNNPKEPGTGIVKFTAGTTTFPAIDLFSGSQYIRLSNNGYSVSLESPAVYISDQRGNSCAVSFNLLGLTKLCCWDGKRWQVVH